MESPDPAMDSPGYSDVTPPPAPPPSTPRYAYIGSPRYAYLAGRLRDRQITMEEATELFGILQGALAAAVAPSAGARGEPALGAGAARARTVAPPPGPAAPGFTITDDDLGVGMIALGAGAGLLAAILKRSTEGPKPAAPKP